MHRRSTLKLALAAALVAAGCGIGVGAPLRVRGHGKFHAHNGIPITPGTPDLGQQPLIPQDPSIVGRRVPLTLLYTSDIHSRIDPFADNYYHHTYAGKGGMARLASKIKTLKKENPSTIVLDSGDYFQGTPYFNFFKGDVEIKTMSLVGFDAITIGNHEFDNGVADLRRVLGGYSGRKVTTNVTFDPELADRYAVVKVGSLRVGIFGLLTEVDGLITPSNFQGAKYYDPIQVARAAVARLEKEADVVVAISHVGTTPAWERTEDAPDAHQDEDDVHPPDSKPISDGDIAAKVPGIDVILSGHTHLLIKRPRVVTAGSSKAYIVSSGFGGGYLGKFSVEVQDGAIVANRNELVALDRTVPPDTQVEATIAPYRQKLASIIKETIGVAVGDFRRYRSRATESPLNNLIADATLARARSFNPATDFAIVSSGTPRNHILSGPITVEDVFYALPFDNKIDIVTVPAGVAKEALRIQRRPRESKRHAISNVTYTLIPAPNGQQQIEEINIGGQPFDPNRTYVVAVTDYMAEGGSGFSMLPGMPRQSTGAIQRDGLMAYIREKGSVIPEVGRIKLKGLTGIDR